jgi:hypothetical protein
VGQGFRENAREQGKTSERRLGMNWPKSSLSQKEKEKHSQKWPFLASNLRKVLARQAEFF